MKNKYLALFLLLFCLSFSKVFAQEQSGNYAIVSVLARDFTKKVKVNVDLGDD